MNSQSYSENRQLARINTLILGVFSFFIFTKLLDSFPNDISNGLNFWVYTDWLIDYSSGFVRRGLSGELINTLSTFARPQLIIGVLVWFLFGSVVFVYIRLLSRSINTLPSLIVVAILFLPSLLPFYLYDHGAFGRKEIIGYLVLLYHLYSLETRNTEKEKELPTLNTYIKKLLPITLLFLPIQIFIHEASFLLFVPIHVLITYTIMQLPPSIGFGRKLFNIALLYLPPLISFLIVFIFGRPSFEIAYDICKKWELVNAINIGSCSISANDAMWSLSGTFTTLGWSFSQAASLTQSLSGKTLLTWITNFLIFGFSTVYIGRMIVRLLIRENFPIDADTILTRQPAKVIVNKYFFLPLMISTPLYIMGWDLGRWFAVTCINFIMVTLSKELIFAEGTIGIETELIPKSLRVLTMLVGGALISTGLLSDLVGLGSEGFGLYQILAVSIGLGLLLICWRGHQRVSLINQKLNIEESNLWYSLNLIFLLLILFSIRLPSCCHKGYNMLSEPFKSLAEQLF